jgi:acetyl esterase/lipase
VDDGAVEVLDEIAYLRDGDVELLGRVYQPTGPGPFPAMLYVHGGVWSSGSRANNAGMCSRLASAGIVVFAIDFRQAPRHRYPQSIADVHYGLRWLRANAARFSGRADWVGGLGVSSGGHQLLLATLAADDPRYRRIDSAEVAGVTASAGYLVLCWPVTDPFGRYQWAQRTGRNRLVALHDAYWSSPAEMAEGSPRRILESMAGANPATPLPPALLVYGTDDANVPGHLTDAFVTAYRGAGGRVDEARFEGMPHGFIDSDLQAPPARQALRSMADFVHRRTTAAGGSDVRVGQLGAGR